MDKKLYLDHYISIGKNWVLFSYFTLLNFIFIQKIPSKVEAFHNRMKSILFVKILISIRIADARCESTGTERTRGKDVCRLIGFPAIMAVTIENK